MELLKSKKKRSLHVTSPTKTTQVVTNRTAQAQYHHAVILFANDYPFCLEQSTV